jgi:hypothetical protein
MRKEGSIGDFPLPSLRKEGSIGDFPLPSMRKEELNWGFLFTTNA